MTEEIQYVCETKGALLMLISLCKEKEFGTLTTMAHSGRVTRQHADTHVKLMRHKGLIIKDGRRYWITEKGRYVVETIFQNDAVAR